MECRKFLVRKMHLKCCWKKCRLFALGLIVLTILGNLSNVQYGVSSFTCSFHTSYGSGACGCRKSILKTYQGFQYWLQLVCTSRHLIMTIHFHFPMKMPFFLRGLLVYIHSYRFLRTQLSDYSIFFTEMMLIHKYEMLFCNCKIIHRCISGICWYNCGTAFPLGFYVVSVHRRLCLCYINLNAELSHIIWNDLAWILASVFYCGRYVRSLVIKFYF